MSAAGELERALKTHTVRGYPAEATPSPFGDVLLEGSTRSRQDVFYRVRPVSPFHFDELARTFHFDATKKGLEEWSRAVEPWPEDPAGGPVLRKPQFLLPPEAVERLEAGEPLSWKDIMETWLRRSGCLDDAGNVTCFDVDSKVVTIPWDKVGPGMLVEFHDEKMKADFAGRVAAVEGDTLEDRIVYLELFEPTPFMDAPEAMAPWKIRPGFHSSLTWKLGYGTAEAWQKSGMPFPPGDWQPDPEGKRKRPHYVLKEPIPLSEVEAFCRKNYPEEPHCIQQSMVMYVVPVQPSPRRRDHQGGVFTPIPEESARSGVYLIWRPEET